MARSSPTSTHRMKDATGSETAAAAALLRAAHQVLDREPRILDDTVSLGLVPGSTAAEIAARAEDFQLDFVRVLRASFVVRSRIAEEALRRSVAAGVAQYVLLGAGFDTFACRQPSWARAIEIFALDHPASQRETADRLRQRGISPSENLRFCPIDFEAAGPLSVLEDAGFDPSKPSLFSWLGVVPYLTSDGFDSTVREIAGMDGESTIVLSYAVPDSLLTGADLQAVTISSTAAAGRGEPWLTRFESPEIEDRLRSFGYSSFKHFGPTEYDALIFADPNGIKLEFVFEPMLRGS